MSNRMYRRPKSGYSKPPKTKLNKVLSDVKKLKKAVPKANDPTITTITDDREIVSAGSIVELTPNIVPSPDEAPVRITRLMARILVTHNPAATSPISFYSRIIIFKDVQPQAATPTVADVLSSVEPQSMMNEQTRRRYKVIMDRTVRTSSVDQSGNIIVASKKLNILQTYDDNGDCTKNSLHVLLVGDQATPNGPDFKGQYEIHTYE